MIDVNCKIQAMQIFLADSTVGYTCKELAGILGMSEVKTGDLLVYFTMRGVIEKTASSH